MTLLEKRPYMVNSELLIGRTPLGVCTADPNAPKPKIKPRVGEVRINATHAYAGHPEGYTTYRVSWYDNPA